MPRLLIYQPMKKAKDMSTLKNIIIDGADPETDEELVEAAMDAMTAVALIASYSFLDVPEDATEEEAQENNSAKLLGRIMTDPNLDKDELIMALISEFTGLLSSIYGDDGGARGALMVRIGAQFGDLMVGTIDQHEADPSAPDMSGLRSFFDLASKLGGEV